MAVYLALESVMQRQSTGRGTPVIHPDFTAALATIAASTHTATCTIRHPGGTPGTLNPVTGEKNITPHAPHYTGPCFLSKRPATGGTAPVAGDEVVLEQEYTLGLDGGAAPGLLSDDIVQITNVGLHGDPTLLSKRYVVGHIERDSITVERLITLTENQS